MPSPFHGMDPYIEDPEVWSDFQSDLAGEIRTSLNQVLNPRYVARIIPRVTYDIVELGDRRSIRPDVGVWESRGSVKESGGGVAVLSVGPVQSLLPMEVPVRQYKVEILETGTLRLVTAIEIVSPVNKQPGHETYYDYRRKRREIIHSDAHLIEIDLLRGGERPPLERPVPPAPYYVMVSREERRPQVDVWPIQIWDALPQLPVPLLAPDPDVALDLGGVTAAVYDRGAYNRLIDYTQPPLPPPLSDLEASWVDERLRGQGVG